MAKATLWACAVVGTLSKWTVTNGVRCNKITVDINPFMVRATSHHEAVGKAHAVADKLKAAKPEIDSWTVIVNDLSEDAVVDDPAKAFLSPKPGAS